MLNHQTKMYAAITVILVAVILLVLAVINLFPKGQRYVDQVDNQIKQTEGFRHPLTGEFIEEQTDFFTIAVMIDNSYDVRPQYGLSQAAIVYEALVEGNITRLMGIFDSRENIDKLGPVRSARPYFIDWANEYGGVYMHVGGSPDALSQINNYNFYNIDQIGSGEIYFWRDNNLNAPHNVFTSSANWLRVGEIKEVTSIDKEPRWSFIDFPEDISGDRSFLPPESFVVDFSNEPYKVEWKFNKALNMYQRWQGDDKHIYDTGEQIAVNNVIIQVASSRIIDDKERRSMDNKTSGVAYLLNPYGYQEGVWKYENGRTNFYDAYGELFKLVPGRTWIEVASIEEDFILE